MVAKVTPWGKTITAPVKPARRSAFRVSLVINLNQARKGKIDVKFILMACEYKRLIM